MKYKEIFQKPNDNVGLVSMYFVSLNNQRDKIAKLIGTTVMVIAVSVT